MECLVGEDRRVGHTSLLISVAGRGGSPKPAAVAAGTGPAATAMPRRTPMSDPTTGGPVRTRPVQEPP